MRNLLAAGLVLVTAVSIAAQEPAAEIPFRSAAGERPQDMALEPVGEMLPLSLMQAVEIALDRNLNLWIQRYERERVELGVTQARGIFDLFLDGTVRTSSNENPTFDQTQAGTFTADTFSLGLAQLNPWGGTADVTISGGEAESQSPFRPGFPTFDGDFDFAYVQPFLRDFGRLPTTIGIRLARLDSSISLRDLEEQVTQTLLDVQTAYWNLINAEEQLGVAREARALAQELHERNRIEVEVGTRAPLELVQSEATIALRDEEIIQAETRLGDAQDELRRLLNLPPDLWDATLEPTTDVEQEPAAIDLDQALATAVEERPELARQRLLIDQAELNAEFRRNQRLPRLDFRIGRGTASSLGQTIAGPNDNPDLVNPNVDLLNALEEALGFDFQRYSASLTFAYPLQNRETKAAAAQAELVLEQALTRLDSVEQDVLTEVRAAVREVNSAVQQIASAQVSRRLQERNLEAEQKRYENGMSTSFQVAEIQEDLTQARSREVAALTNYRIALARYHQAIGVLVEESGVTIVDDVVDEP